MRYEIHNPFIGGENYNCFACAPHNKNGLKLRFERCDDTVRAYWQPSVDYQGYNQIVHGGIQATLLDEVASWTIFTLCGVAGITQKISIDYKQALPLNEGLVTVIGSIANRTARVITVDGTLCIGSKVYTRSTADFRVVPSKLAERSFGFPDPSFFHIRRSNDDPLQR